MNQSQFQRAAGISAGLAARWFPHIDAAMTEFGINSPTAKVMFIAQVGHESNGFNAKRENFNYSVQALIVTFVPKRLTKDQALTLGRKPGESALPIERQKSIANLVYQKRFGNNLPGDGWKYHGGGLIQTTFLDMHTTNGVTVRPMARDVCRSDCTKRRRTSRMSFFAGGLLRRRQF